MKGSVCWMDEMVDILDEFDGQITGNTLLKNEAHKTGVWHGAIHIIIVDKASNKTLIQKRAAGKQLYPNMWDIAVGGHIAAGETAVNAARRELQEELGISADDYEIKFVERIREKLSNSGIVNREYVSIFIIYDDIDINDLVLQENEVDSIKWCTKEELNGYINKGVMVPHVREYELLNLILV